MPIMWAHFFFRDRRSPYTKRGGRHKCHGRWITPSWKKMKRKGKETSKARKSIRLSWLRGNAGRVVCGLQPVEHRGAGWARNRIKCWENTNVINHNILYRTRMAMQRVAKKRRLVRTLFSLLINDSKLNLIWFYWIFVNLMVIFYCLN